MTIGTIAVAVALILLALHFFSLGIPPIVLAVSFLVAGILLLVAGSIPLGGPRA